MTFHFCVVDNEFVAPGILYFVIGLSDFKRGWVKLFCCNSSNNAPSNALVEGGYFKANRIIVFVSFNERDFKMAKNRLQDYSGGCVRDFLYISN